MASRDDARRLIFFHFFVCVCDVRAPIIRFDSIHSRVVNHSIQILIFNASTASRPLVSARRWPQTEQGT